MDKNTAILNCTTAALLLGPAIRHLEENSQPEVVEKLKAVHGLLAEAAAVFDGAMATNTVALGGGGDK